VEIKGILSSKLTAQGLLEPPYCPVAVFRYEQGNQQAGSGFPVVGCDFRRPAAKHRRMKVLL